MAARPAGRDRIIPGFREHLSPGPLCVPTDGSGCLWERPISTSPERSTLGRAVGLPHCGPDRARMAPCGDPAGPATSGCPRLNGNSFSRGAPEINHREAISRWGGELRAVHSRQKDSGSVPPATVAPVEAGRGHLSSLWVQILSPRSPLRPYGTPLSAQLWGGPEHLRGPERALH